MSTLFAVLIKILLFFAALERVWKHVSETQFMHMFLFIVECQIAGMKKRKKEKDESNNRNSGKGIFTGNSDGDNNANISDRS